MCVLIHNVLANTLPEKVIGYVQFFFTFGCNFLLCSLVVSGRVISVKMSNKDCF